MRTPNKKNGLARILRKLFRSEAGGSELLGTILMTGVGIFAVSQTIKPVRDAMDSTGDALRQQAHVLSRGSDTGSINGFGGAGSGGMSGFDLGAIQGVASGIFGQLGQFADGQQGPHGVQGQNGGQPGDQGTGKNGDPGVSGAVKQ